MSAGVGASNAENGVRLGLESLGRDGPVTFSAFSEAAFVDSLQRTLHSLKLQLLAATELQCHLLRLHRVHSREPADRCIEVDRLGRFLIRFQVAPNLRCELFELGAEALLLFGVH